MSILKSNLSKLPSLSKNIYMMGLVSFFNDIASEMLIPIIPIFLRTVLGAPMPVIGLIEGVSEATANILNVFSGILSDKLNVRKPLVVFGYSLSSISKLCLAFAYSWPVVLLARFSDRLGKGIRTSARDALITDYSHPAHRGKAFGFHRAADTAGAVIGPLVAMYVVLHNHHSIRSLFYVAFIPAMIGVLVLVLFVKDKPNGPIVAKPPFTFSWNIFGLRYKVFMITTIIFSLGACSEAFLILRAQSLGFSLLHTLAAYVTFNISYALLSIPAGMLSDRTGQRIVLITGYLIFAVVFLLFAITTCTTILWVLFPLYGIYKALTEGISRAYISNLVAHDRVATAFGVYQTMTGLATFFGSFFAGILWAWWGASVPFVFGSMMAAVATIFFIFFNAMYSRTA